MDVHLVVYQHMFTNRIKLFFDKAELYTKGIVQSQHRNIERISEGLDACYHQMQHFISESRWDAREVIDQVAREVSQALPKRKLTGLIIDESGWVKKGDKSVGVGWQYCGNVGKLSNSQVAVFACLSNGDFASMVDARLYLPKDWCNDPSRCREAKIPAANRDFKTKLDLAMEIICHQQRNGISYDFIGGDGYYGNDADLADAIEDMGSLYMLDIHSNQPIYTIEPELIIPEKKGTKGPDTRKAKATGKAQKVADYQESLTAEDWEEIEVRNTCKGKLTGWYHFARVFIWNKNSNQIRSRQLIIRKTKSGKDTVAIKYSFTNANLEQYTKELDCIKNYM